MTFCLVSKKSMEWFIKSCAHLVLPCLSKDEFLTVSTEWYYVFYWSCLIYLKMSFVLFPLSFIWCFTGVILSIQWIVLHYFHWVVLCVLLVSSCLFNENCCTISTEWYYVFHWLYLVYLKIMCVLFPMSGMLCFTGVILSVQCRFYSVSTERYFVLHLCFLI